MSAIYWKSTREKARYLGGWDKDFRTAAQRAAETMIEMHEHPERFCDICQKRKGVCKHTKKRECEYNAL